MKIHRPFFFLVFPAVVLSQFFPGPVPAARAQLSSYTIAEELTSALDPSIQGWRAESWRKDRPIE